MKRILKWVVPVDDKEHLIGAGPVVLVASQHGRIDSVEVWTEENTYTADKQRRVTVVATGQTYPESLRFLGSVVVSNGNLVWHLVGEMV